MKSSLAKLLKKAGLPEAQNLLGKIYSFSTRRWTLCGVITSVDNANEDNRLSLGVSNKYWLEEPLESLDWDGKEWVVVVKAPNGDSEASDGGRLKLMS